jgi:TP901 family phage tail tape measure protein
MANPQIEVEIGAKIKSLFDSLNDAEGALQKFAGKAQKIGTALSLAITTPLTAFSAVTLRTFASFEASLNKASAITGATGNELEKLSNKARELGSTTQFSASQAADAITFLGQAGFSTTKIVESLDDTLKLAAASGLDLGRSADIVSNVLSGFQLETSELSKTVDLLSKAFTTSNQDLNQLAEAIKFAGPTATSLGVSISETVAAIGALSDSGIQASSAGTGLRRVLATLAKDAKKLGIETFDASGKLKPLADIIGLIEERGLSGTEALEIFGLQGGPIIETLLARGSSALRQYSEALEDAGGTADRLAKAQTAGLSGALKTLNSAFEELQLRIAESGLAGAFEKLINKLTSVIIAFSKLDDTTLNIIVGISAVAAAIGPLLLGIGTAIKVLPILTTGFVALKAAVIAATGPFGLIALAIAAAVPLLINLNNELNRTSKISGEVKASLLAQKIDETNKFLDDQVVKYRQLLPQLTEEERINKILVFELAQIRKQRGKSTEAIKAEEDALIKWGLSALQSAKAVTVLGSSTKQTLEEFSKLQDIANEKIFRQFAEEANAFNKELDETIRLAKALESIDLSKDLAARTPRGIVDNNIVLDGPPVIEIPDIDESSRSRFIASLRAFNDEASAIILNGIQMTIGDFAFSIGEALGNGANVLKAAGGALLQGIAQIANQLGQAAIAIGVGMIAIQQAFSNPFTAIAAGVALIALAGFISSKVPKITSGGAGVGVGTSGVGAGSSFTGTGGTGFSAERNINLVGSFRIAGSDLLYVIDQSNQARI